MVETQLTTCARKVSISNHSPNRMELVMLQSVTSKTNQRILTASRQARPESSLTEHLDVQSPLSPKLKNQTRLMGGNTTSKLSTLETATSKTKIAHLFLLNSNLSASDIFSMRICLLICYVRQTMMSLIVIRLRHLEQVTRMRAWRELKKRHQVTIKVFNFQG